MMPNEKKFLALAKAGKVDAIFKLAGVASAGDGDDEDDEDDEAYEDDEGGGNSGEADEVAYRWLLVAGDFGHKKAARAADDMLETSSLRYDDGQMVVGLVHLELGEEYLSGKETLPVNIDHAKHHLAFAKKLAVHKTTDVAKDFNATRRKLSAETRAVFNSFFPPPKTKSKSKAKSKSKTKIRLPIRQS